MKIALLAGQGTLPVISVKMFSGSWEIYKKNYDIIICGLNTGPSSVQFKKHSVWRFIKSMRNCQKVENATLKTID